MSRIGKKPISIPEGVEIKIEGTNVIVKGPKGELKKDFGPDVKIEIKDKELLLSISKNEKSVKALWGTARAIIYNMIEGVNNGCEKKLQIEGVGYRANMEGDNLVLQVGFSHPVKVKQPEGIKFLIDKNIITISGIDKELVGQIAAKIRKIKLPEPYKGKGIRYVGEYIRRKAGKKVVASSG